MTAPFMRAPVTYRVARRNRAWWVRRSSASAGAGVSVSASGDGGCVMRVIEGAGCLDWFLLASLRVQASPPPRHETSLGHPQAQPRRTVTYRRGLPGPWTPTRGNNANRRPPRPTLFPLRFGDHLPKFRVLRAMPKGWLSLTPGTSHTLETPSPRHLSPFVGGLLPLSYKYWDGKTTGVHA